MIAKVPSACAGMAALLGVVGGAVATTKPAARHPVQRHHRAQIPRTLPLPTAMATARVSDAEEAAYELQQAAEKAQAQDPRARYKAVSDETSTDTQGTSSDKAGTSVDVSA